jgi:hypothetical protein
MVKDLSLDVREKTLLSQSNTRKLKNSFGNNFDKLRFRNGGDAALYYLSMMACYRQSSLWEIKAHIAKYYEREIGISELQNARDELVENGIIAQILFTSNDAKEYSYELADFFPNDPLTVWEAISGSTDNLQNEERNIISEFSSIFYHDRFSLESRLLKENQVVFAFNKMWPYYFLLTHSKQLKDNGEKNKIALLLSGLQQDNQSHDIRPSKHYLKLLKTNTMRALLDKQNTKEQNEIHQFLHKNYPNDVEIRYTTQQLYGSTRRVILENFFTIDAFKVHPLPTNLAESNDPQKGKRKKQNPEEKSYTSYVGIIYFNQNKHKVQVSFNSWWEHYKPK